MDNVIDARCLKIAEYIVKNSTTVSMASKKFGISKNTINRDVNERLKLINPKLFENVRKVLDLNNLNKRINDRCLKIAEYIVKNSTTVRAAAKKFGVSKSTVHKDVSVRLKTINPKLFEHVRRVLDLNKKERHIRGGIATKKKYLKN